MRTDARFGNPGNPSGPEDHAPGVLATGRLAQDLARSALRRTHHLVTRLAELNEGRWNLAPLGTGSIVGAVLQNVAETVESPELSVLTESLVHGLPGNWNDLIGVIQSFLPPSLSSLVGAIPALGAGDRWVEEVKREAFASKHGRRDSQWSWKWAISNARKLIYLESPLFGATASGTEDHEANLIQLLHDRLSAAPDLRVIVVVPRRIPFGPGYESFAQRFHIARNQALTNLTSVDYKRVVIFHPIGFPGRPEVLRSTFGIVDDVWAIFGASTFSRRGLTFDGSTDIVLTDKNLRRGTIELIQNARRQAMARILGVVPSQNGETPHPNWVRLAQPKSAFDIFRKVVDRGGDGLLEPLWSGIPETELPALDASIADPDGRNFTAILAGFADVLSGLGPGRV